MAFSGRFWPCETLDDLRRSFFGHWQPFLALSDSFLLASEDLFWPPAIFFGLQISVLAFVDRFWPCMTSWLYYISNCRPIDRPLELTGHTVFNFHLVDPWPAHCLMKENILIQPLYPWFMKEKSQQPNVMLKRFINIIFVKVTQ